MFVTVNEVRYQIWLRGSFREIRFSKKFEDIMRRSYRARYGSDADTGKTIFEVDSVIGMISQSRRAEGLKRGGD